jgi:hypothetical protein
LGSEKDKNFFAACSPLRQRAAVDLLFAERLVSG